MSDMTPSAAILGALRAILPAGGVRAAGDEAIAQAGRADLPAVVEVLTRAGYVLAGIVLETIAPGWQCRYVFYHAARPGFCHIDLVGAEHDPLASISPLLFAADWPERELEDLFGIPSEGHPLLGDFVLHNEDWPEGVAPMRRSYDVRTPKPAREGLSWRPQRFVDAPGAFSMSVGPVYGGVTETAQFRLESEGEQILHATPRLFYKYRGLEKIAEGRPAADALLLAERLNGTSAFAHAVAFSRAAESVAGVAPPPRAEVLRLVFAELERLRSHVSTIDELAESTGLTVPAAMLSAVVEDLLRLSGRVSGHRYLFGLARPGGLAADVDAGEARDIAATTRAAAARLGRIVQGLSLDNGFLDRVEEVGTLSVARALHHGVVGPVGRASGLGKDLRAIQPYGAYRAAGVEVALAEEGDAFARLRVLADEAQESARLIGSALEALPDGPVQAPWQPRAGAALGWVEAPIGAAFHWLRLAADGSVVRWRVMPPSFTNWPALSSAVEGYAFQDFPIILASFGLSVSESDR